MFERDCLNFDQENFILDNFSIDWNSALKLDRKNIDYSTESFPNKINNYCPLKKIRKEKLSFRSKPWIATGLKKSISIKISFQTVSLKRSIQLKNRTSFTIRKPQKPITNPFEKN